MKNVYTSLFLILLAGFFFSCIKEQGRDKCLPEYRILLEVKDKNYSNIANIAGLEPKDEQLSFRQYIADLSYRLYHLETRTITASGSGLIVTDDNQLESLVLPDLIPGKYVLSIFGNISQHLKLEDEQWIGELHPDGREGQDTYIAYDTISFSESEIENKVVLQRTKGYLFIQLEGIPDSVARIDQQVGNLYREVNQNLGYVAETSVFKSFTTDLHPSAILMTTLSPTIDGKESTLRLSFYTKEATTPFFFLPDIRIVMKRNQITAYKINYLPEGGIEVWMSVEGAWVKQHDMDFQ